MTSEQPSSELSEAKESQESSTVTSKDNSSGGELVGAPLEPTSATESAPPTEIDTTTLENVLQKLETSTEKEVVVGAPQDEATTNEETTSDSSERIENESKILRSAAARVLNNFALGASKGDKDDWKNEELHPQVLGSPRVKELAKEPMVQGMLIDSVKELLDSFGGRSSAQKGYSSDAISDTFKSLLDVVPESEVSDDDQRTLEVHKYKDGKWVTDEESLYSQGNDQVGAPKKEIVTAPEDLIPTEEPCDETVGAEQTIKSPQRGLLDRIQDELKGSKLGAVKGQPKDDFSKLLRNTMDKLKSEFKKYNEKSGQVR